MYNKAKPKQTDFFFKKKSPGKNRSSHKIKSNFKFYSVILILKALSNFWLKVV